jgi:hypothetical protein
MERSTEGRDSKSLWLTANADMIYVIGALDLTSGLMVLETAPGSRFPRTFLRRRSGP